MVESGGLRERGARAKSVASGSRENPSDGDNRRFVERAEAEYFAAEFNEAQKMFFLTKTAVVDIDVRKFIFLHNPKSFV